MQKHLQWRISRHTSLLQCYLARIFLLVIVHSSHFAELSLNTRSACRHGKLFLSELQSTTYRLTVINKYGINIMDD